MNISFDYNEMKNFISHTGYLRKDIEKEKMTIICSLSNQLFTESTKVKY